MVHAQNAARLPGHHSIRTDAVGKPCSFAQQRCGEGEKKWQEQSFSSTPNAALNAMPA